VTAEDEPSDVFAEIRYDAISSGSYSYSEHPRWVEGLFLAWPMFFMDSKHHWLELHGEEPFEDLPDGYLVLRLDKDNWRSIVNATEAQVGIEVERTGEQG